MKNESNNFKLPAREKLNPQVMLYFFISLTMLHCSSTERRPMDITKEHYGKTPDGIEVFLYTMTNGSLKIKVIDYGGAITELWAPDKEGKFDDIVLGFDSLAGYLGPNPYFGCIVGRYGNRIKGGRFKIDGIEYKLATNDKTNHLHGGKKGFDKVVWDAEPSREKERVSLTLRYRSPDGEEKYPGNLLVTVIYELDRDNRLTVRYKATTDKPTIVNLTQHSYFNLAGAGSGDILRHQLMIKAEKFTVVDEMLIPTGELRKVEGTPMDFRSFQAIGSRISQVPGGYDHNYVLDRKGSGLEFAAKLKDSTSGRTLEISTTEPGIQFYSGNFLDGSITGKKGKKYGKHFGLCLETQHYPDSPNNPMFPSTILRPGEKYETQTVFQFGVSK